MGIFLCEKHSNEWIDLGIPEPATRAWTSAFALNLPAPLYFAYWTLIDWGFVGLPVGLAGIYFGGWRLARTQPSLIRTVAKGGYVVAAIQLCPILQLTVGAIGVAFASEIARQLSQRPDHEEGREVLILESPLEAFLATLATGAGLLVAAFAIGLLLDLLSPSRTKPKPPPLEL
jgi:hypothetical protein